MAWPVSMLDMVSHRESGNSDTFEVVIWEPDGKDHVIISGLSDEQAEAIGVRIRKALRTWRERA